VAQLVEHFKMPIREAWGMTLREYTMMQKHQKAKPIESYYDKRDLDDILASFEVKGL